MAIELIKNTTTKIQYRITTFILYNNMRKATLFYCVPDICFTFIRLSIEWMHFCALLQDRMTRGI